MTTDYLQQCPSYYRENISGTKLDRPELGRLLMDSHRNDILLVEQIDRQRQKQGVELAHTLGKYQGKQVAQERHQKVLYYRQVKKETADATGYSTSQICHIQALYRQSES
ncbi:recombinase family protein [Escherichia coli]|nr:resolvase [Salmonella enterica subsp. enterica serovar Saintpaul]EEZ6580602.1 recombinase family protein [Escherichia coli]TAD19137.1 resolvase [Salmonella enterica subsp. enterica serovar Brancaster]EFB1567682.1 resolvase [Escherichia coli]EFD8924439.1 recombinase family protein [Escherichia coli]